jgi:putative iron-dependent peroxidase
VSEHLGQKGITGELPQHGRYLTFQVVAGVDTQVDAIRQNIKAASEVVSKNSGVIGFGPQVLQLLGGEIEHSLVFPNFVNMGISIPATSNDIWVWLRGEDPGDLLLIGNEVMDHLAPQFEVSSIIDGFKFKEGRDLSGYVDGTENPVGDDAVAAAFTDAGESYVAVQKWQHNLAHFATFEQHKKDHTFGRRLSDNEELDDAPISAHVKRTAQESFTPEAFMLRRSMPYTEDKNAGLVFVCFANSPRPFKQQLNRMVGKEDGVTDALFTFSRPLTGEFYWCPGMKHGQLDLSKLSID